MSRRPHDPILNADHDLFNRASFVEHVERALISKCSDCNGSRATGSIVSLVGSWGAGKSSILNLVGERLQDRDDCIIIRFVPWFVSSGEHLIRYFFELLAKNMMPEYVERDDLYEDLIAYGRLATYGADIHTPGSGAIARGFLDFVGHRIKRDPDIFSIKSRIEKELDRKCINIVCLIDEVDRLSDLEIREVTRLLRAVGDFQRISYLVAFDEDRVATALAGEGPENTKIGREYIQKIINLRIEIPKSIANEGLTILSSQMEKLHAEALLPERFSDRVAYRWLSETIAHSGASPRTIVRTVEKFSLIRRMIGDDLDWVDALAFTFLEEHAFESARAIRQLPDKFVQNPASYNEYALLVGREEDRRDQLRKLVHYDNYNDQVRDILSFLFPGLGTVSDKRAEIIDPPFNRIQFRSPLLSLLRLGLLPGSIPVDRIRTALGSTSSLNELLISVFSSSDGEKLDQVFDYIGRHGNPDQIRRTTIEALAQYESDIGEHSETRTAGAKVADTFAEDKRLDQQTAGTILENLLESNWSQVARILRRYIFMHGMYKWSDRSYGNPNIKDSNKFSFLVQNYVRYVNSIGGISAIIRHSNTSHAIWLMMDYYQDSGEAMANEFELVKLDPDLFAKFLKLCFGPNYSTDYTSVSGLISRYEVRNLIEEYNFIDSDDDHLRSIIPEALSRWGSID